MNRKKIALSLLSFSIISSSLWAQGTLADYQRAFNIRSQYSGKAKNTIVRAHAIDDTHRFWYSVFDGEKEVFKEVDADKLTAIQAGRAMGLSIQEIVPELSPDYREMFISGICPTCWDNMFGFEPEEESLEDSDMELA